MKLLFHTDGFSYYLPNKVLSPYIAYYSISVNQNEFFAAPPLFIPDLGGSIIISRCKNNIDISVWGPFSQLVPIQNIPNDILEQYFIEFQPGGLSRLVYQHTGEILNSQFFLDQINPEMNAALMQISDKSNTKNELLSSFDSLFLNLLSSSKDFLSHGRHILLFLQDFEAAKTMHDLSVETNYCLRHLNRFMNHFVGVSGKSYMRIKRFNQAIEMLKQQQSLELIAFQLGYYDTAHFVHDFTQFSGLSPTMYRKNKSDFYNETLKKY